jgi:hypothetical protein
MKIMFKSVICLSVIVMFCFIAGHTANAQAKEMYSWTDENGVVHFSDTRPAGQEVESQAIPEGQALQGDSPYQQGDAANEPSLGQQRREEITQKNQEARANQVVNEAQCAAWQAEVDRLEPNRRVFFTNEKGETERMDDVERTNKVAQLKSQIAKNCK